MVTSMKKRILALLLAAVTVISSAALSSCKGGSVNVDGKPMKGALTTRDLKNVYSAKELNVVGTELENLDLWTITKLDGDKMLINGYDNDTGESKALIADIDLKNITPVAVDKETGENVNTYVNSYAADTSTGEIWYLKTVYRYYDNDVSIEPRKYAVDDVETVAADTVIIGSSVDSSFDVGPAVGEDSTSYYVVKANSDGSIVSETDISSLLNYTDSEGNQNQRYINSIYVAGDKIVLQCDNALLCMDPATGELLNTIDFGESSYINNVFVSASGKLYASMWGDSGIEVYEVDILTGKKDKVTFPFTDNFYDYSFAPGGNGYDFYLADYNAFYGYNMGDEEPIEICNYTNSDVNSGYNQMLPAVFDDGRLVIIFRDDSTGDTELLVLTKVDPKDVKEKYVITVAAEYIDDDIRSALVKFNRTSDEYKVIFTDYQKYNTEENDYNGAADQLAKDLISKDKAPDIVILNSYSSINLDSLVSKGVFVDLEQYMDADDEFNKDDYLTNVFEAEKINGKLYTVAPVINIRTLAGKKSVFGDKTGWTMKEFMDMQNSLAEGESMFSQPTRSNQGMEFVALAKDEFIGDDGKCTFDSEEFKSMLEFLKSIPEDYDAYQDLWNDNNNYWQDMQLAYKKGTTKLYETYFYRFDIIPQIEAYLGEEAAFIGYPSSVEGSNGAILSANSELAILSSSKVVPGAWAAIKYLLSDSYQNKFSGANEDGSKSYSYAFPIKKSIIEKKMANDILPEYYTDYDENGNEIQVEAGSTMWLGDERIDVRKSTEEDTQRIYDIIKGAKVFFRQNQEISDIISQEAAAFYDGQKSVDDVAKVINSRIQILVNERR